MSEQGNNQMVLFGASSVPAAAAKVFKFTPTVDKKTGKEDGGYIISLEKVSVAKDAMNLKGKENVELFKERQFEAGAALMRQVRGDVAKLDDNHVLRRAAVKPQKNGVIRKTIVIDDMTSVRQNSLLGHKLAVCQAYGWTLEQFEEHAEEQRAKLAGKPTINVEEVKKPTDAKSAPTPPPVAPAKK